MAVFDKQRRRKVYPFEGFRVAPIMVTEGIGVIDKGSIAMTAESTATQTFAVNISFKSAPRISVTTGQFTLETSAPFTGNIDWIAAGD